MSQNSIVIKGVGETIRSLEFYETKALSNIEKQIEISATNVESDARAAAPRDTGNLSRKIRKKINKREYYAVITYMGKGRAFYGKFAEFGTKTQPAKPFLGPAWEREKDNFLNGVINGVNEANK